METKYPSRYFSYTGMIWGDENPWMVVRTGVFTSRV